MYGWLAENRGEESISFCSKVLGVDRCGYHRYMGRKHLCDKNAPIVSELREIHQVHPEYGVMRKRQMLSMKISYGKAYKLCKENGFLQKKYKRPHNLTKADPRAQLSEDLIRRDFKANRPFEKWVGDITQVICAEGKLYISGVMDCFDGAIVGYAMADHMKAELCTKALGNAVNRYGKQDGLIFHSDRGSQYTSREYRRDLSRYGMMQSMGRTGSCFDNARMESFWATLKKDLLYRLPLRTMTRAQVIRAVFRWIECEYHMVRPYSANPWSLPPLRYRALQKQQGHHAA